MTGAAVFPLAFSPVAVDRTGRNKKPDTEGGMRTYVVKSDYVHPQAPDPSADATYVYELGAEPGHDLQECVKLRGLRLASNVLVAISAHYRWLWYIVEVEQRSVDVEVSEPVRKLWEALHGLAAARARALSPILGEGAAQTIATHAYPSTMQMWVEVAE